MMRGRLLPDWVKSKLPSGEGYFRLRALVRANGLNTVCEFASCPNIGSCWDKGSLTLMILGGTCSRSCRFCDVPTGNLTAPDPGEPEAVARILAQLHLRYAVITSVDRDDLPDGGAVHWARTLLAVRRSCPEMRIEALIPDFRADADKLGVVFDSGPDVLSHNLETVAELQRQVRPQGRYEWSLEVLKLARARGLRTKSGLMLGMGETETQIESALRALKDAGCEVVTLGQYLQPSPLNLPVARFVTPEEFLRWKRLGESLGFAHVESGPLVRSSYRADHQARAAGI